MLAMMFFGRTGPPITAPADGVVLFPLPLDVRGNGIVLDHEWGRYTGYGHPWEVPVSEEDLVAADDEIGLEGASGRATRPHLGFHVPVGGVLGDPVEWRANPFL